MSTPLKSVIGETIGEVTTRQLTTRQNALANKGAEPEWQKLYTGKTAWVKLSSSVDVNGSSTQASNSILTGRGITGSSTINPGYNTGSIGTRPIPGITNVAIQAINRFGTLRNATVEFKVYDVERLSELETLYMRPGFSILLEWGHTAYKTSSGVSTNVKTVGKFFNSTVKSSTIEKEIRDLQNSTEGNYGGLFGYIKNFQWSFNTDGSYNCRVDIISKGELLESLQYSIFTKTNTDDSENEENLEKAKSPLHKILYSIKEAGIGEDEDSTALIQAELEARIGSILKGGVRHVGPLRGNAETEDKDQFLSYIRLSRLLLIINKVALLKDQNKIPLAKFLPVDSPYVTHDYHFSGDPGIAMLPKKSAAYAGFGDKFTEPPRGEFADALGIPKFHKDSVHELWLNVDYVIAELDNAIELKTGQASLFTFLQNLLGGVEGALGGINEFDIAYNEDFNYHYIVDRRYIQSQVNRQAIKVSGKNTTVSNLSITSKLSPNLGTLIAISAQNSKNVSEVGIEAENLFKWNEGLQDRVTTERTLPDSSPDDENEKSPYEVARQKILDVLLPLAQDSIYNAADFSAIRTSHSLVMKTLLQSQLRNKKLPAPGIIPFELSITMDGITGFKIGQTFQIEDEYIFPKKYRGVIAFIITGLEHSIGGNRWTTTIKAQTITN